MFSNDRIGSLYCAAVPAFMTMKFFFIGIGLLNDEDAVKSMSRNGNKSELLKGPLLYGLVFIFATYLFWKQSTAVLSFMSLCMGDGFAEIIGRKYGQNNKLPWSTHKSFAGMIGYIVAATLASFVFLKIFPHISIDLPSNASSVLLFLRILIVNIFAAFIESISFSDIDNLTIFTAASLMDYIFLKISESSSLF